MTTWTCKGLAAGAMLALAGCDEAALGLGGGDASRSFALRSADLGSTGVTLVPPAGYCIDRRSLRQSFALMARCDTLGERNTGDAPLAVITATATARLGGADVNAADMRDGPETILSRSDRDGLALVQVQGTPPSAAMRDVFWRAVGPIGDHVVGLTIYEATNGTQLGTRAPDLLVQTMQRTLANSAAPTAQPPDNSARLPAKPIGNAVPASLSE